MNDSPYRTPETPAEEKILERFQEIFSGKQKPHDSKYVASTHYGFGHISVHGTDYTLVIGNSREPDTITLTQNDAEISLRGYHGMESADKKLSRSEIESIADEIQTAEELTPDPATSINGDPQKRMRTIGEIQKRGHRSSHSLVSNVTKHGLLSVEQKEDTVRNPGIITIELEREQIRLRFFVNRAGEVTKIETEKNEGGRNPYKTLDIHRIRGGFSKRKELKAGSSDFQSAVRLLDDGLETFKLPRIDERNEEDPDDERKTITANVRKKIRKDYDQ